VPEGFSLTEAEYHAGDGLVDEDVEVALTDTDGGRCTVASNRRHQPRDLSVEETIERAGASTRWLHDEPGRRWQTVAGSGTDPLAVSGDAPTVAEAMARSADFTVAGR
jgi:hypothetical protein